MRGDAANSQHGCKVLRAKKSIGDDVLHFAEAIPDPSRPLTRLSYVVNKRQTTILLVSQDNNKQSR